jgi:DNA polymerase III epsilon subunit-like protein
MSYLIIDTETTGLPNDALPAHEPSQPRAASVSLIFADEKCEIEHEWHGLIRPDGWTMPREVEKINGLSTEKLQAEGGPILYPLAIYGTAIDLGRTVVAHNIHFDTKIMRGELRRAGLPDRYLQTQTICTMVHGRRLCGRGSLAFVHQSLCGQTFPGAHNARFDSHACLAVLRELIKRAPNPLMLISYPRLRAAAG